MENENLPLITRDNHADAMACLVFAADTVSKLAESLCIHSQCNLTDEELGQSIRRVMLDETTMNAIGFGTAMARNWKRYLELRSSDHNEYASYLMTKHLLRREPGIDALTVEDIVDLRTELIETGEFFDAAVTDEEGLTSMDRALVIKIAGATD